MMKLRKVQLDAYPLGFVVGFCGRGTVELARRRAGPSGRVSARIRVVVGWFFLCYLTATSVACVSARPERSDEGGIPIRRDPVEDDPHVRPLLRAAERDTDEALKGVAREFGFVHFYWGTKKRILREKYGVEWRSPSEMNPKIAFD